MINTTFEIVVIKSRELGRVINLCTKQKNPGSFFMHDDSGVAAIIFSSSNDRIGGGGEPDDHTHYMECCGS